MKLQKETTIKIEIDENDLRRLKMIFKCFFDYHSKFPKRKEPELDFIVRFNEILSKME